MMCHFISSSPRLLLVFGFVWLMLGFDSLRLPIDNNVELFDCESTVNRIRKLVNGQKDVNIMKKQPEKKVFCYSILKRCMCQENQLESYSQRVNKMEMIQKLVFGQFFHVQFTPKKNNFIHFPLFPSHSFALSFSRLFTIPMNKIICSQNKRAQLTFPFCFRLFRSFFFFYSHLGFWFLFNRNDMFIFFFFTFNMQCAMCMMHNIESTDWSITMWWIKKHQRNG